MSHAADNSIKVHDKVLMYKGEPIGKWLDPYLVERVYDNEKLLDLDTGDRLITTSIDKVKRYLSLGRAELSTIEAPNPSANEPSRDDNKPTETMHEDLRDLDKLLRLVWPDGQQKRQNTGKRAISL